MMMDADILDLCKENIQPLRQGRKANRLGLALQAQTDSGLKEQLDQEREQYELAIMTYEGDDPLQPRCEYVHWIEQSYPKHGRESNLLPLLEDTIILLKDNENYKQDPRFIELVIKYIESQENDVELFQMVYGQGLGTNCSFFYKAWADALDRNLDIKRADQVYQLGISNNAQPLEPLQSAHSQFQMSVGRRMVKGEIPCVEKQVSAETSERQRQVLGKLKKATSVRSSSTAPGKLVQATNSSNKKGPQFSVFNEENENLFGSSSGHTVNMINSDSTHKENKMKAGPWNQGMKIRSRPTPQITPVPSTPSFKVCIDEDEASVSAGKPTPSSSKALKIRKAEIHQDPLTLFKSPHPGAKGSLPKFELFAGGKEFSFEEIRWAHYLKHESDDNMATPSALPTRRLQFTPCKSATPQCSTPLPMMSPSDCFVTPLKKAPRPVVKPFCMPLPEENEVETDE